MAGVPVVPPCFVAIDNGSQSTKVSIIDAAGTVHASARVGLQPYASPLPGQSVHPGDDVWDSIVAACREAMARFQGSPSDIVGVGLCTIRYCRAILDQEGLLVEPMLSWMDARVGQPYRQSNARARYVTTSSGYVTHRLTGAFVDTAANYQGVWPIDQQTWRWSNDPAAFAATGMDRVALFDLVDPGERLGAVTLEAARMTGLPGGIPVYATANDKAVEALGAGLRRESDVVLSLGTYIAAMTIGDHADGADAYWVNFGARPGEYLYESIGIRRGMWTVSWFRSLLEAVPGRGDDLYSLEAQLGAGAASIPVGSGGLMAVLDWLAPPEAPGRRGALIGFDGSQDRFAIYRAILEGIAFTMADNVDAMARSLGRSFERVILTGGGARSDLIAAIIADVFSLPVHRPRSDDSAGMGAAICAAVGSGSSSGWDAAVEAMVHEGTAITPSHRRASAYEPFRRVHAELRPRVHALTEWATEQLETPLELPSTP